MILSCIKHTLRTIVLVHIDDFSEIVVNPFTFINDCDIIGMLHYIYYNGLIVFICFCYKMYAIGKSVHSDKLNLVVMYR